MVRIRRVSRRRRLSRNRRMLGAGCVYFGNRVVLWNRYGLWWLRNRRLKRRIVLICRLFANIRIMSWRRGC